MKSPGVQLAPLTLVKSPGVQLALVTLAALAGAYARTAVSPLQEMMRVALGLGDTQMALLQGPAMALPVVLGAIPVGFVVDRHSRVRLLFVFALLNLAGTLLTAVASAFPLLLFARALVGLGVISTWIVAASLLSDLFAPARRGRATMIVAVGQYAGMAIVFALGGTLAGIAGISPSGWRTVLLWLSAPLLLVMLSLLLMSEPPRSEAGSTRPSIRQAMTKLMQYRALVLPVFVGLVLAETAVGAVSIWAAPTLSRHFGLGPDRIGTIMASGLMVSGVAGPLLGGMLADLAHRYGGPRCTIKVLAVLIALSVPASLFPIAPQLASATALFISLMTTIGAIVVLGTTLLTVLLPNELRGSCMSLLSGACVLFGTALAPVMVSALSAMLGGTLMIGTALSYFCVTAGLLGTAILVLPR